MHHWGVGQVPSDPEMTSNSEEVWLYGRAFGYPVVLPESASTEPMIGDDSGAKVREGAAVGFDQQDAAVRTRR